MLIVIISFGALANSIGYCEENKNGKDPEKTQITLERGSNEPSENNSPSPRRSEQEESTAMGNYLKPVRESKVWQVAKSSFSGGAFEIGGYMGETFFEYATEDAAGALTEKQSVGYTATLSTAPTMTESGRYGYFYESGFSNFNANTQRDVVGEEDLGTSVKGHFAYFSPVGIVNFGSRPGKIRDKWGYSIGLGYGLGYMSAKGKIALEPDEPLYEVQTIDVGHTTYTGEMLVDYIYEKVNVHTFALSGSAFHELRYGSWKLRFKINMVTIPNEGPLGRGKDSISYVTAIFDVAYIFSL